MNRINIIILGITLLATSLFSQEVGFNDSVKLKNGKVLEKVKAVVIKDSLVVVDSSGAANVYSKKEVSEVVKNGKLTEADQVSKSISSQKTTGVWSDYRGRKRWSEAFEDCANIGMRVPTFEELKAAYNSGLTKSWEKDGCLWWTASDSTNEAIGYSIGGLCDIIRRGYNFRGNGRASWLFTADTRCIR